MSVHNVVTFGGEIMTEDLADKAKNKTLLPYIPPRDLVPMTQSARELSDDASRVHTVRQLLADSMAGAVSPAEKLDLVTTGHYELDHDTRGFRNGAVWIFGAKSSWGKSAWTLMVADENIKRGRRVLIVTCEDAPSMYGDRLMIRRARVDPFRFDHKSLTHDERARVGSVVSAGEDVPVMLDARGKSVEWAVKKARNMIRLEAVDLVAFDYLHAFDADKPDPKGDRRAHLNFIARHMTDLIKTEGKTGIIFGQVTPDVKDPVPDMYCIRDSKDVVNAAEVVAIGFEPQSDIMRAGQRIAGQGDRVIHLAKNKPGPGPKGRIYKLESDLVHKCFEVTPDPNDRYRAFDNQFDDPLADF